MHLGSRHAQAANAPSQIGPYRIIDMLGEGGMGVVYRAQHRKTGRQVALKTVHITSPALLSSIRREVFALRSVEHPSVVRIVDDGVDLGVPWYAMELLVGKTLRDHNTARSQGFTSVVDRSLRTPTTPADGPTEKSCDSLATTGPNTLGVVAIEPVIDSDDAMLPPRRPADTDIERVLTLMYHVCQALAFVHGRGLVHRDLKPDNIFIRSDGLPVLVDFGLALQFAGRHGRDVLDMGGSSAGTPAYMAPEQIRGDLCDARADLYAVGCMLYECVTGRPPFLGSVPHVLAQHFTEPPSAPSELVDGVTPELDQLILALLEKKPRKRMGYADDVAAALKALGARTEPRARLPVPGAYLYRPELAGRRSIIDALGDALDDLERQRGGRIFIGGASGVGKTRLAMELATRAARRDIEIVTGTCADLSAQSDGFGASAVPLHPFRQVLHAIADRCRSHGIEETKRIVGEHAKLLAPHEPSLATLPGTEHAPDPSEIPAEAARYRLVSALERTLEAYVANKPMMLVVDDLQWADELSLALLEHLDDALLSRIGLLIVGTFRADELEVPLRRIVSAPDARRVDLGMLDQDAASEMVSGMLAMDRPPTTLIDFLLMQSDGNPFFIAEYLRAAIEEQVLRRGSHGRWRFDQHSLSSAQLQGVLAPRSVTDLMRRRFRNLSDDTRIVCRMAAVIGREMDDAVLLEAAGLGDRQSFSALEQLRERKILEEETPGRLRFVHDKLREHVYGTVGGDELRDLHARAARVIERHAEESGVLALMYPVLAHHYARADAPDRALHYLELAGEQALERGASREAKRHFTRALQLTRGSDSDASPSRLRRARSERGCAQASYDLGELAEAEVQLLSALHAVAPSRASTSSDASLVERVRATAWTIGELGRQLARLVSGRVPTAPAGDERERARIAAASAERLGQIYFFRNRATLSFGAAIQAANHAERLGPSPELARCYATLGMAFAFVPLPQLVDVYAARAASTAASAGSAQAQSFVSLLRGLYLLGAGRHHQARRELERTLELADEVRDARTRQECMALLGHAIHVGGDPNAGVALYDALWASARETQNEQGELWAASGRAMCLITLGRVVEAIHLFERIEPMLLRVEDTAQQLTHAARAVACYMNGDSDTAKAIVARVLPSLAHGRPAAYHSYWGYHAACEVSIALWRDGDRSQQPSAEAAVRAMQRYARIFRLGRPDALIFAGLAASEKGHKRRARRWLRDAVAEAEALSMPHQLARAHFELGRLEPKRGHRERARALWETLDARWWLARSVNGSSPDGSSL